MYPLNKSPASNLMSASASEALIDDLVRELEDDYSPKKRGAAPSVPMARSAKRMKFTSTLSEIMFPSYKLAATTFRQLDIERDTLHARIMQEQGTHIHMQRLNDLYSDAWVSILQSRPQTVVLEDGFDDTKEGKCQYHHEPAQNHLPTISFSPFTSDAVVALLLYDKKDSPLPIKMPTLKDKSARQYNVQQDYRCGKLETNQQWVKHNVTRIQFLKKGWPLSSNFRGTRTTAPYFVFAVIPYVDGTLDYDKAQISGTFLVKSKRQPDDMARAKGLRIRKKPQTRTTKRVAELESHKRALSAEVQKLSRQLKETSERCAHHETAIQDILTFCKSYMAAHPQNPDARLFDNVLRQCTRHVGKKVSIGML